MQGILTRSLPKVYQLLDEFWQISDRMVLEPTAKRYLNMQDSPQHYNCFNNKMNLSRKPFLNNFSSCNYSVSATKFYSRAKVVPEDLF